MKSGDVLKGRWLNDWPPGVIKERIRVVGGAAAAASDSGDKFSVDMEVEARYAGKKRWWTGVIAKVNQDGTYNVVYADGGGERGVCVDLIRHARSE